MESKEIALIAVFSAMWIVAQDSLGPIVGRFSIGPLSLHGTVNRVVGWALMLVLAERCGRFGRVSVMATIAALGTRVIRLKAIEGLVVGAGYALGGLVFDMLFFMPIAKNLKGRKRTIWLLTITVMSGAAALLPYLLLQFSVLSHQGFIALTPMYAYSMVKGVAFSLLGTLLCLGILPRLRKIMKA